MVSRLEALSGGAPNFGGSDGGAYHTSWSDLTCACSNNKSFCAGLMMLYRAVVQARRTTTG